MSTDQPHDADVAATSPAAAAPQDTAAVPDESSDDGGKSKGAKIMIGSQRPIAQAQKPRAASPRVKAVAQVHLHEGPKEKTPVPNRRAGLTPDMEAELAEALGDVSLNDLMAPDAAPQKPLELDREAKRTGRILQIHHGDVFVDLGGRDQGVLPLLQFNEPPQIGQSIEVTVARFNAEDGLYQLALPNRAVDAGDWSSVSEGAIIEVRVSGHNKGGLEVEAGTLKGFIPAGQIAPYRVEDLSAFVGEKWTVLVTEVNPERRRLVLSRRSMIERERAEAKERLMAELNVGDVREGIVTRIQDFGAFIDLGGVDGLLHVSRLSYQRVRNPADVLKVGERVKVKVVSIDADSGKIGLSLRDLMPDPWMGVAMRWKQGDIIRGPVVRILDKIGALVEIEPGIEGMIHISELAHQRAWRVADYVTEGQEIEAKITNIDLDQKRIGLSLKAMMAKPEPVKKETEVAAEPETLAAPLPPTPKKLKGGIGGKSGGAQFGLKW